MELRPVSLVATQLARGAHHSCLCLATMPCSWFSNHLIRELARVEDALRIPGRERRAGVEAPKISFSFMMRCSQKNASLSPFLSNILVIRPSDCLHLAVSVTIV